MAKQIEQRAGAKKREGRARGRRKVEGGGGPWGDGGGLLGEWRVTERRGGEMLIALLTCAHTTSEGIAENAD